MKHAHVRTNKSQTIHTENVNATYRTKSANTDVAWYPEKKTPQFNANQRMSISLYQTKTRACMQILSVSEEPKIADFLTKHIPSSKKQVRQLECSFGNMFSFEYVWFVSEQLGIMLNSICDF